MGVYLYGCVCVRVCVCMYILCIYIYAFHPAALNHFLNKPNDLTYIETVSIYYCCIDY